MKNTVKKIYCEPNIKVRTIEHESILAASVAGSGIIDGSAPDGAQGLSKHNIFFDGDDHSFDDKALFPAEEE